MKARVDNEARRWSIDNVRKSIFKFGRSITSRLIEAILGPASLVPTRVGTIYTSYAHQLTHTECFLCQTFRLRFQLLFNARA